MQGDWSADSGYERGRDLDAEAATAVFAANDRMALGLVHALADRGIRVPHDISVVGFDDLPETRHLHPLPTTIRQDFDALGTSAVMAAIAAIDDRGSGDRHLTPHLIERASTARSLM